MFDIPLLNQLEIVGSVFIAALLGALIGLERERADKPAGLRTMALIASAAALVVALGEHINELSPGMGDPTRALHGVITGIGFLGAGTIAVGSGMRQGGVTTAATVFVTAAIGITVGLGAPLSAALSALLVLGALRMGGFLEKIGIRPKRDQDPQLDGTDLED
jgi:putative Mg2+ transporter-C (MgtC) family protein